MTTTTTISVVNSEITKIGNDINQENLGIIYYMEEKYKSNAHVFYKTSRNKIRIVVNRVTINKKSSDIFLSVHNYFNENQFTSSTVKLRELEQWIIKELTLT